MVSEGIMKLIKDITFEKDQDWISFGITYWVSYKALIFEFGHWFMRINLK